MDLRFSPEDEQYRVKLRTWLEENLPQEARPTEQDAEFAYRVPGNANSMLAGGSGSTGQRHTAVRGRR